MCRLVSKVTWCIVRNSEEILHAVYTSAKFMQRESKAFLSPLASPHPKECIWYKYPCLYSLNVQINLGSNIQNYKNSTFLTLSGLKILNPKIKRDLQGVYIQSELLPSTQGRQITSIKVKVGKGDVRVRAALGYFPVWNSHPFLGCALDFCHGL